MYYIKFTYAVVTSYFSVQVCVCICIFLFYNELNKRLLLLLLQVWAPCIKKSWIRLWCDGEYPYRAYSPKNGIWEVTSIIDNLYQTYQRIGICENSTQPTNFYLPVVRYVFRQNMLRVPVFIKHNFHS